MAYPPGPMLTHGRMDRRTDEGTNGYTPPPPPPYSIPGDKQLCAKKRKI